MAESTTAARQPSVAAVPQIRIQDQWWVLVALGILVLAINSRVFWFLNFVHVFSAILWTGTDIFMGFILGPILRQVDFPTRRAIITRLMPKMLFYMPTVSTVATTAGYYLAEQRGYFALPFPQLWWVIAALVIVTILLVQGLGILLPTNLMVYFEMRKEESDGEKIQRLMRRYIRVVASQAVMQLAIIIVMAKFVTGL